MRRFALALSTGLILVAPMGVQASPNPPPRGGHAISVPVAMVGYGLAPSLPAGGLPAPKPHVGFYTVHPRVGLATYFSLSSSWPGTQAPLRVIAKIHPGGETCGADPQSDTGAVFGTATLARADHHTVWKEWTPARAGTYVVCTWLGEPVIATGSSALIIEPRSDGAMSAGALVAAATSKTPAGPPRAVFPTAPRSVYARFELRGVRRGRIVSIEFRDTNGDVIVKHVFSQGPGLQWATARVDHERIAKRLGYWLVSVRVGGETLGRIHFLVPAYPLK